VREIKSELRQMSDEQSANGITTFSRDEYDDHQKSVSSKKEWPGINVRSGEGNIFSWSYSNLLKDVTTIT